MNPGPRSREAPSGQAIAPEGASRPRPLLTTGLHGERVLTLEPLTLLVPEREIEPRTY